MDIGNSSALLLFRWNFSDFVPPLLFVFLMLVFILFGQPALAQKHVFSRPDFVASRTAGFSLDTPDYLVPVKSLSAQAALQMENIFNETYLMVIPEIKSAETRNTIEQLEKDFEFNLMLKGGLLIEKKEITIGKLASLQSIVRLTVEDTTYEYLITFIDTPKAFYKIYAWTLASQKELLNDFKASANSFSLIDVN